MAVVTDGRRVAVPLAVVDTLLLSLWVLWFLDATPRAFDIGGSLGWMPPSVSAALGCLGFLVLARMPPEQRLQDRSAMFLAWATIYVLLPAGFYALLMTMFAIGFD